MILLVHLLFGAAVGSAVNNIPLAIILAFLSHYFLDLFPHIEYGIENIEKKQWHKILPDVLKIFLDFCLGILLIWIFSDPSTCSGWGIIYICAFMAILPDGFTVLNHLVPNKILEIHNKIHHQIIHFLKGKKISKFWRIVNQVIVVAISIIILRI